MTAIETRLSWPYDDALVEMHAARDAVIADPASSTIFVGEHREEVVTLGRHAPESQLVARAALETRGVLVRRIERGGGATAHGPGQLVVYPVLHLERSRLDVRALTCALLEAARDVAVEHAALKVADLQVRTDAGGSGLFAKDGAKLASVGFRVERGVVTHGLALNVDNDLSLFDLIAPCGVQSQRMASLRTHGDFVAGVPLRMDLVAKSLGFHVARRCVLG